MSDDVYERILFNGRKHARILSIPGMALHSILLNSLHKTYAMTVWCIGYAVLPTIEEAHFFRQWNINTCSCVPPFIQSAARHTFDDSLNEEIVASVVAKFEERRNIVVDALKAIPGFSCIKPAGAFYAFPNIGDACENLGISESHQTLIRDECRPVG